MYWGQDGGHGGDEKCLKAEATGFGDGLDTGCGERRGVKDDAEVFVPGNRKDAIVTYWDRKTVGGAGGGKGWEGQIKSLDLDELSWRCLVDTPVVRLSRLVYI